MLSMKWSRAAVAVLAALTCLSDPCQPLVTGPGRRSSDLASGNDSRSVTPDQLQLQKALGIALLGDMYLNVPIISPEQTMPVWGSPSKDARPSFSHVHSLFEAGQKGALLQQNGVWVRHENATLVLSYHDGCPVQLYRIAYEGELHTEVLGSPLENAAFRPTSILWPEHLVTLESLCPDRATLVSFVTIAAWDPRLREAWEPVRVAAEYPQHAQLISRLASRGFNADQSPLLQTADTAASGTDAGQQ